MESKSISFIEKDRSHFALLPAPAAGGGSFEYNSNSDSNSPDSTVNEDDSSTSFATAKDFSSRASGELESFDLENSNDQVDDSSDIVLASEESGTDNDDEDKAEEVVQDAKSKPGFSRTLNENEIIQTMEELCTKEESDRSKRFEYLLKQTEIWGHFMQPAYQQALKFSEDNAPSQNTEDGLSSTQSSLAEMGDSSKNRSTNKRKRTGKANPVLQIPKPDASASSSQKSNSAEASKYVTHFDVSPTYIENGTMRDYQVRGLNWMISLYDKGLSGILADEMGLGKTIQAISLLGYLKHFRGIHGPHLIIAPKSTLPNWMNEINKWCPTLKAICLMGAKDERPSLIKKSFLPKRWNVCVTSYEMARIEKATLAKVNYHYIIIDEAQKIKNENSLLSARVRQFNSSVRLLLTGTPLQNNLHELWALLNFLLPDVFSSADDFDSWFNEGNCMGNESQTMVDRLHAVLRPFLLRRIKADVEKSLPPKVEMRIYVQMTPMQREWYKKILLNDIEIITTTGAKTKKALHNIIMHLRKVCNHPYLFEGAEPKPFTTDSHLVYNCGKMIVLDKLLLKLKAQNSRVLLFSQMTRMLDILEDYCIWREFDYCRLDGGTDYDIRQEDIDEFNAPGSSKFIYLLSTRAGGLGINLASANIVIIYDSDWNPQMDLQAMDRAHRIGQTKEVKVFRFVVQDTAEEKIVERAAAKLHLDKMVIQKGRLVGADRNKAPDAVEMLSIVRFGAEKVLKGGKNEGITDADVDTILAQSKIRSEEMDRRLNGMNEDNLRELTIEQVELNWDNKPSKPTTEENYFDFEGQNYRELRKRKTVSQPELYMVYEKRRKDTNTSMTHTGKEENVIFDASMELSDNESVDSDKGRTQDLAKKREVKKPAPPHDYQFCPLYIWELYWRKVDYFQRHSSDVQVNHLPKELPLLDVQQLKASEMDRLKKCELLNGIESREMRMMKSEGFTSWRRKHFKQFLSAMREFGPSDLEAVTKALPQVKPDEVVKYSQVFWMRCHELMNFEEVMEQVNRPDLVKERRMLQQALLDEKIKSATDLSDVKLKYEPHHWMGHRFTNEDDIQLLNKTAQLGMLTPDLFGVLQVKLALEAEACSSFLRTRTKEELHSRFNLLMYMIEQEIKVKKQSSPSIDLELSNALPGPSGSDSGSVETAFHIVKTYPTLKKLKVADSRSNN